jgi:predicted site-specific integrase-resolvase
MKIEISLPDAASILGVPWHTARRLAVRGVLGPARQIAGTWILEEVSVRAYLDAQRTKSNVDSPRPSSESETEAGAESDCECRA